MRQLVQIIYPFKRQPHKMIKYTQTIRKAVSDELFEYLSI